MKVAILTLPLHTNYGGILQAFALQNVLEKMGANVQVLHYVWKNEQIKTTIFIKRTIKLILRFLFKDHSTIIFPERYLIKYNKKFTQHIDKFINDRINVLQVNNLSNCLQYNFDAIIVGSDQIWRPQYFKRMWEKPIDYSYLSFIPRDIIIKKIAYACSFGTSLWEYTESETESCKSALKEFSLVSVREVSGVEMIKKHFGVSAKHVLDPTMLLTRDEYDSLIDKSSSIKDFMFSYILDDNEHIAQLVQRISDQKDIGVMSSKIAPIIKRGQLHSNILISIEEWIWNIRESKLVITDSFHACVFSIIYNKPFIVVGNKNRGQSRILSLLQAFGLEDHLISKVDSYSPDMSYELPKTVQPRLEELRLYSMELLRNSLY